MRDLCCAGTGNNDFCQIADLVHAQRSIRRGAALFRSGDEFRSIYGIRSGFFKTVLTLEDGREQVTGFQTAGETLGLDGIGPNAHICSAIALADCSVGAILYSRFEQSGDDRRALRHNFHMIMSREIARANAAMLVLGSKHGEERLAVFLLNLSQRYESRGYSPRDFNLPMKRDEIASYCGLKFETVSGLLSRLEDQGCIVVRQKSIHISSVALLERCLSSHRG